MLFHIFDDLLPQIGSISSSSNLFIVALFLSSGRSVPLSVCSNFLRYLSINIPEHKIPSALYPIDYVDTINTLTFHSQQPNISEAKYDEEKKILEVIWPRVANQ